MAYFLFAILGLAAGGFAVYMLVEQRRKKLDEQKRQQDEQAERIQGAWAAIHSKHEELQKAEAGVLAQVLNYVHALFHLRSWKMKTPFSSRT